MMKNGGKLTIALVVAETAPIPDILGGGAERLVTMLIEQNEIDDRVQFVVVSKFDKQAKELSNTYKNTTFLYLRNNNIFDKMHNLLCKTINRLFKLKLCKHGYYDIAAKNIIPSCDILVDQNGYCKEMRYISDKFGKIKTLAHIHWKVNPIEREIDGLYGGVIGVSNFVADYWVNNSCDEKIQKMVVYSAVNENRFDNVDNGIKTSSDIRNKYHINDDDVVYMYCGRLHEQKGARELIKAFLGLNHENIKLLIVGGSDLLNSSVSSYEEEIHNLAKHDKNIIFTGYVKNEKLSAFYSIADIQIIPTIVDEAAGLVAIEGMYNGLPIIATNSGGLPEYLDEDSSILVERDIDLVANLSNVMELLYLDKDLRVKMSEASKKRSDIFTQKKYYNDFVDAIENYHREFVLCRKENS